ncbi:MAG TPA: 23S rRNA (adenine(2503)-C(2))-methyltransferase RlmN [Candidatus Binatia bacterium]|nr:23S rRNA (adenine(2503)-C(2))-methyltransferase RlmN [Candidatus Binatia bacterium]
MSESSAKPNIKDLSLEQLEAHLVERQEPAYRARQIWQWLFRKGALTFAEMTNLSEPLREKLSEDFSISRLALLRQAVSADGTKKFLLGLSDRESIETVLIPEAKRLTLCVSTQAGCGFGCAFCATAVLGLKRNLRASEILDQILEASRSLARDQRITHVVLMGMGEPLANYAQTVKALKVMTDTNWGIGLSPRRITLSTVGLVPQIHRLMAETKVNLAISLHAATDSLRGELMPVNRKYSLQQLMECCRALPIPRRKRITFEYVLLRGINDSVEDAEALCQLLRGIRCKVNVIPFNPHPGSRYRRPDDSAVERFQQALQAHGLQINVRRPRGDDIQAACGQLQGEEQSQEFKVPDSKFKEKGGLVHVEP